MTLPGFDPLRHRWLNGYGLLALIVGPMCVVVVTAIAGSDLGDPAAVSSMIAVSVRLAVPWLYLAFAASSLVVLFPGITSRWILRNRRIFGLSFAAGMAWQLAFIVWLVFGHFDYYLSEAYSLVDLAVQIPGYLVLIPMTVTSFAFGRRMITPTSWKRLHKGGIYFLWAVVWSTYWYELYYYDDIQAVDYAYYWAGFAAWGVRMAAWTRQRAPRPATG